MKRVYSKVALLHVFSRFNGETRCYECGTPCQGFKAPNGNIYCWDCYKKIWGKEPD